MMTTSASRSHRISCACAGAAEIAAAAPATAAPEVRKPRRSIDPGVWSAVSLRDGDILGVLPMGAGIVWQKLRCPIRQGQSARPGSPAGASSAFTRVAWLDPHFAGAQCGLRCCLIERDGEERMTGSAAGQTGEDEIIARYFRPLAKHPA